MTLVVEDGSGISGAESYVSVADCVTYAENHGLAFSDDDETAAEAALRRATTYLDNTYRARFPGYRRNFRAQALEWPRTSVLDISGYPVPYDQVPIEIVNATCEAAVRELAAPGGLSPDVTPGGIAKSLKAGSVQIEYAIGAGNAASQQPVSTLIDGILGPLIGGIANIYSASAVRG